MNREDLLFEYFEGALSTPQEELLFDQLQNDLLLREEFNQQMKILMLAKQDSPGVKAPIDSTNAIFSSLGIKSSYYYTQRRKENFIHFLKSSKFRKSVYATAILFFAFFSSFFMYDSLKDNFQNESLQAGNNRIPVVSNLSSKDITQNQSGDESKNTNSFNNISSISYLQQLSFEIIKTQELISSIKNQLNSENRNIQQKLSKKEIELAILRDKYNSIIQSKEGIASSSEIYNSNRNDINPEILQNFIKTNDYGKSKFLEYQNLSSRNLQFQRNNSKLNDPFSIDLLTQNFKPKNNKLELSYRSNAPSASIPNISSDKLDQSKLNFEIGVGYKFNSSNQIGLIVGRDNFPQSFSHSIDGSKYKLIQSPNLVYYGVGYKYIPENIFYQNLVLPFIYGLMSGTSVGPYIKAQTGLELNLFRKLSIFAGIENGTLIYNVDNTIYSTNKLNFVYGMNIKF